MSSYALTYAVTTYNRLPFLKQALNRLMVSKRDDEEIIVVDGGSTDGTKEYLTALYAENKIDVFLSEPDYGQGHGVNKALLKARGELIKPINDDDIYDYDTIARARDYMVKQEDIDLLFSRVQIAVWTPSPHLICHCWKQVPAFPRRSVPFAFGDLGLLLRRNSLPLIGLFAPELAWTDYEYALRVTATHAKIAYLDKTIGIRLTNDDSKSARLWRLLEEEKRRLQQFYIPAWKPTNWTDLARSIKGNIVRAIKKPHNIFPDKSLKQSSTGCGTAESAFKIGEELLIMVQQSEPSHSFLISSY